MCCEKSKLGETYFVFPGYTNDFSQKSIARAGDNGIFIFIDLSRADEAEAARAFIKRSSAVTLKLLAE